MNYIHKVKKIKASASDTKKGKYFIHSEDIYVPDWMIEGSGDWEMDYEDGTMAYDSVNEEVYVRKGDFWERDWGTPYGKRWGASLGNDFIRYESWEVLDKDEKIWRTLEGRDIPFSRVTQQHWSNTYHYHLRHGQSKQVQIAKEMLEKNNWELLPQNRF